MLQDEKRLIYIFQHALDHAGVQTLSHASYKFPGEGGVTGLFLLSESHTSFHTYPEFSYIAIDIFTCGNCDPAAVMSTLLAGLAPSHEKLIEVPRGMMRDSFVRLASKSAKLAS